ncbi:translation initiation factor IF-3, C-terminal domain-containing protein [Tribonema minus]|uniref:Translation initiation factor IF-3, C-terminal domain-containing protein n=1 Tax=Tribonema minus TaxID=303371 RepID=A0A836C915_9STRA|nr:translation initiation factor IF-3, C-terminal domain-containing protein [Tribonema minus]
MECRSSMSTLAVLVIVLAALHCSTAFLQPLSDSRLVIAVKSSPEQRAYMSSPSPPKPAAPAAPAQRPAPRFSSPQGGANSSMYGRGRGSTRKPVEEDKPMMNSEIRVPKVRVSIAKPEGDEQLGIMDTAEALAKAQELGVDLIMIAENAEPPVCKIIDFGKLKYMSEKKKKDSKKNAKQSEMKEVKMSYKIEDHDYQVRLRNAKKFIAQGDRVKVVVQFRGREQQHMDLGHELLTKIVADCEGTVATDGRPKREGNRLSLILAPKGN